MENIMRYRDPSDFSGYKGPEIELTPARFGALPKGESVRPSFAVIEEPAIPDILGDIFSSILPGVIFATTFLLNSKYVYPASEEEGRRQDRKEKIKKMLLSLAPVAFVIIWYGIKKFRFGRHSKIGNLSWILIGNTVSFITIIVLGLIVLAINSYKV